MKNVIGCLSFIGLAILVLGIAIGYSTWQVKQSERHQAEAQKTAADFSRFTGSKAPPPGAMDDSQARYRKGHLLLINADAGMVDEMFYTLPPSLRAAAPDDVGTEVFLHWDEHETGKYDNGGTAWKTNCDAVVYDVSRNTIIARQHFEGEDPPPTLSSPRGSKAGWEKLPTDQVMKFLQDLPVRQ